MTKQARKYFLAIRHRPSGGLLPSVRGYGFTRTEPSLTDPPRLFSKPAAANAALRYWLEGEHYERQENFGNDSDFDGQVYLAVKPRRDRKAEDMEIVEIEVIVRTLSQAQLREL